MQTPEADRINSTSATAPDSSPAVQLQESPFSNFVSTLSPINSVKATKYGQRFSQTQFPTPPPVFRTPRLDLHRETSYLKSNEVDRASRNVYGDPGNGLNNLLVPCAQKALQPCSPSGCVDDYLTDPTEVEGCTNSNDLSVDPDKKVSSLPSIKVNNVSDGNSDNFMHTFQDQAEEDALKSHGFFRTATDQRVAEKFQESFELSPKERAYQDESSTCIISSDQHHEQYASQNAGTQHTWQDGSGESPKNLQNVEAYKISSGSVGPVSKGSLKESSLYQRGIRRHLQFEAAMAGKGITTSKSQSSHNVTQESDNSVLAASPRDWESLMTTNIESREVSSSREATTSSQNSALSLSFCQPEFVRSSHHDGSLPITDPFSSVFDTHFGSIAESVPLSSDIIPRKFLPGTTSSQGDQLSPEGSNHLEKDSNSSLMSSLVGKIHDHTDTNQQYNQVPAGASLVITQYTDNMRPLCNSLQVTLPEQQTAPCEDVMLTLENTDRVEELNTVSPKKKRKKVPHNSESDGCKRCNCKRSRCLKLYCECFAAGIYCIDSCACESCFNKPEYEETVTDTRQQIESRNPLAFAPKIINHSDSPANVVEEDNLTTPASARHKRGCNCKKSKCLKKYCECFQANVGCSDGCRCEGCSNSFGKKTETKYQRIEIWENQSRINSNAAESLPDTTKGGTLKPFSPRWKDLPSMSHLTPLSYSYPGVEEASAPPTIGEYQNLPRPHLHHQSSFNSSAVNPHWQSPVSFMPHLYENRDEHRCGSDSAVHETARQDDNMPESQTDTSTPTNASKANIPSKKRVSPPPFRSQEFKSRSSPGVLQTGRKFSLQNVPLFPPLTPYSKSKDNICENESISKCDPSDNGSAELEKGLDTSAVDTASG